ncbi:MAG: LemA family protein [Flammeovirgaceae bacterium]|nr:LemA family protein [Flammeovirgaceae bacterium]
MLTVALLAGSFILVFIIYMFNKLIRQKNMVAEAWSGIDVQLKKRYNLIPNLVSTVKGYAKHETELFETVTALRNEGMNTKSVTDQGKVEDRITDTLSKVFVAVEAYPDLKANVNFLDLQKQLTEIENDLQMARRYYNGATRDNNILIQSFPSNLVAGVFNFKEQPFFEIHDIQQRINPEVKLS